MARKKAIQDPHLSPNAYTENPLGLPFEIPNEEEDFKPATRAVVEEQLAVDEADYLSKRATVSVLDPVEDENGGHIPAVPATDGDVTMAAALAALQREIAELRSENKRIARKQAVLDKEEGAAGFPYMYYKRPNDRLPDGTPGPMAGWIVCAGGGVGPTSGGRDVGTYSTRMHKGFKPLPRYGVTEKPRPNLRPGNDYIVFLENGGAKEVPASQVLQLRWHISSPVPGTIFPQYEKAKAAGEVCHFNCDEGDCSTEFWFTKEDQVTASAALTHLRKAHEYKQTQAIAVLASMGIPYRTSRIYEAVKEAERKLPRQLDEEDEE